MDDGIGLACGRGKCLGAARVAMGERHERCAARKGFAVRQHQDFRCLIAVASGKDDVVSGAHETPYQMPTQKTRAARDEYAHVSRP
ncbi:hypothetical protein GCM10027093_68370 [Paraburkholderia jirisanensis]